MSATILAGYNVTKPVAPTVAVGTVAGSLDASALYGYKITYVTGNGETDGSTAATVTTSSAGSVSITALPVSSNGNVIGRRIYRTAGGGSSYLLLEYIEDNTTSTYVDIAADGDLGAAIPTMNTAHSLQTVDGRVKLTQPLVHSLERAITAAGTTIADAYQLSSEYNWLSTVASGTGVRLPEVSSSVTGQRIKIKNNGANTVNIYPYTGQTINGGTAGDPVTLAAAAVTELVADVAAGWAQI